MNILSRFLCSPAKLAVAASGLLLCGACGDDPPGKLFEEEGVWSLNRYSLGEGAGISEVDPASREDAFQLKFDAKLSVVQTAACGSDENGRTPADSICRLDASSTWACRCFAYAFEEEQMVWVEFEAGGTIPAVDISGAPMPSAESGGMPATEEEEGPLGPASVMVSAVDGISSTYTFRPLPDGVFGSDGVSAQFVFRQRASSTFDEVTCDPCQ